MFSLRLVKHRFFSMKFFSSSVIPFISQGLLRNQNKQTRTHNNPIKPLTKKVVRHPNAMVRGTTMNGATAAPAIWPTREAEIPLESSFAGNQRDITPEVFGSAPASPTPKRNRTMMRDNKPVVRPVSAVNTDHHNTMRVKTTFCPFRSPIMPEGISNKAYARENADNTKPNSELVK